MKKYVIIRADDLGFSEAVNFGIAKTVKEGPVRTVGLMVNMRAAEHGLNLLDQTGCCIGLHSNISVGRPVCRPDEIPTLVDREGKFYPSSRYRSGEDFADRGDIYREGVGKTTRINRIFGNDGKETVLFRGSRGHGPETGGGIKTGCRGIRAFIPAGIYQFSVRR